MSYEPDLIEDPPLPVPPAMEEHREHSSHVYPAPKIPRTRNRADSHWTIGDALRFLDPKPPRRTLARWLTKIEPVGERKLKQGGPAARTYPAREIMQRHARWVLKGAGR